jgi:hypothetical protein
VLRAQRSAELDVAAVGEELSGLQRQLEAASRELAEQEAALLAREAAAQQEVWGRG